MLADASREERGRQAARPTGDCPQTWLGRWSAWPGEPSEVGKLAVLHHRLQVNEVSAQRRFHNFTNYRLRLLLHCGVRWQTHRTARLQGRSPRLVAQSPAEVATTNARNAVAGHMAVRMETRDGLDLRGDQRLTRLRTDSNIRPSRTGPTMRTRSWITRPV